MKKVGLRVKELFAGALCFLGTRYENMSPTVIHLLRPEQSINPPLTPALSHRGRGRKSIFPPGEREKNRSFDRNSLPLERWGKNPPIPLRGGDKKSSLPLEGGGSGWGRKRPVKNNKKNGTAHLESQTSLTAYISFLTAQLPAIPNGLLYVRLRFAKSPIKKV